MGWKSAPGLGAGAKIYSAEYTIDVTKKEDKITGPNLGIIGGPRLVYGILPDPSFDTMTPTLADIPPGSLIVDKPALFSGATADPVFIMDESGGPPPGVDDVYTDPMADAATYSEEEFSGDLWDPQAVDVLDEITTLAEDRFYKLEGRELSVNLSTTFPGCLNANRMNQFPGWHVVDETLDSTPPAFELVEYFPYALDMMATPYMGGDPSDAASVINPFTGEEMEMVPMSESTSPSYSSTGDGGADYSTPTATAVGPGDTSAPAGVSALTYVGAPAGGSGGGGGFVSVDAFDSFASGAIGIVAVNYDGTYVDPDQGKMRLDDDIKMYGHSCSPYFNLGDPTFNALASTGYQESSYNIDNAPWTYNNRAERDGLSDKFGYEYLADEVYEATKERLNSAVVNFIDKMQIGVLPRKDTTRRVPRVTLSDGAFEKISTNEALESTTFLESADGSGLVTTANTIYDSIVGAKIGDVSYVTRLSDLGTSGFGETEIATAVTLTATETERGSGDGGSYG